MSISISGSLALLKDPFTDVCLSVILVIWVAFLLRGRNYWARSDANCFLLVGVVSAIIGAIGLLALIHHGIGVLMCIAFAVFDIGFYLTAASIFRNIAIHTPAFIGQRWERTPGGSFSIWHSLGNVVASNSLLYKWFLKRW